MKHDFTHDELEEQFRLLAEVANDAGPEEVCEAVVAPAHEPVFIPASNDSFDEAFQKEFDASFEETFGDDFDNEFGGQFDTFEPDALTGGDDGPSEEVEAAPDMTGEPLLATLQAEADKTAAKDRAEAAAGPGFWGFASAFAWVAVAFGAPTALIGAAALQNQNPGLYLAMAAIAIAPALLILYTASAARESRRTRDDTRRIAALAETALAPTEAAEDRARAFGLTVRAEIGALQTVVETALGRFAELEAAAQRNAIVFEEAVTCARVGAGALTKTLLDERLAFEDMTAEFRGQTDLIGENVTRQIRMMRETSRLVRQEYVAADETLTTHFNAFAASAQVMADRTAAIDAAAASTNAATQRLDATVMTALEALTKATSITDTARQSADAAAQAAQATAGAVRDSTRRAVSDARRVAQMIRNETTAMEEAATTTLGKLKEAADEARRASEEAQAAADKHAESIQRRLSAIAAQNTAKLTAMTQAPVVQAPVVANEDYAEEKIRVGERFMRTAYAPNTPASYAPSSGAEDRYGGGWSVGPASGPVANDPAPVKPAPQTPKSASETALAILDEAGIDAGVVFATPDLDFIANRARQGGAARRSAVKAAAPEAVETLARLFERSIATRAHATAFRAKPELASANGGKKLLVAYLLVDAALG